MVTPVRKDSLTDYQAVLATVLRIVSPIAGLFTGSEIQPNPNSRTIRVPDISVDDYIVDSDIARIGADHMSGSQFVTKWINGLPPIYWRTYSMSRHRSFGFTVYDEQEKYSPIKNLVQEYTGRKMKTTVLRDHDKYCLLAGISGHMTGKLVPRVGSTLAVNAAVSTPGGAAEIACTGNAADYQWIAEPGETYDNETQPSFATVKGMLLNEQSPLATLDELTIMFTNNWFDSNFANSDRILLVPPVLELTFINELIEKGAGTESAFKLLKDADISGLDAAGYLGTLKGSWKLHRMHPEFFPKVYTSDSDYIVNPVADESTPNHGLRQVAALAVYKNAIQTYEHFEERREEDGGVRFKGKEYVQDFSYDCWAIDQLSEGIVPLFLPDDSETYDVVADNFGDIAALVATARGTQGIQSPQSNYPMNPPVMAQSQPLWFHGDFSNPGRLDTSLPIQVAGDIAHRNDAPGGVPPNVAALQSTVTAQEAEIDGLTTTIAGLVARIEALEP